MKELIAVVAIIVLGIAIGQAIVGFSSDADLIQDAVSEDIQLIIAD